jgi:GNAT superfamily N-acetyltransferase
MGATIACGAVHRIETLDPSALDRVEPLWLALVAHHGSITDLPTREPAETWRRRREEYARWLSDGLAFVLLAVPEAGGAPEGYAVVRVHPSASATFELGAPVGQLESLAVLESARGTGAGTRLIRAARERLRALGVTNWVVEVLDANPAARRLYEREGFRPFYSALLSPID